MHKTLLALAATTLALIVAGCGGSDDKSKSTGSSASAPTGARGYAETGQALDDICTKLKAETDPIGQQLNGSAKHDAPLVAKLVAAGDKYLPQIKSIVPDPKLKDTFAAYTAEIDKLSAMQKELLQSVNRGDDDNYHLAAEALNGAEGKATGLARALGAKVCGRSS